jgi:hypothetical protein
MVVLIREREQLFSNQIGTFFGMDVLVSSVVVLAFLRLEARRAKFGCFGYQSPPCCALVYRSLCRCGFTSAKGRSCGFAVHNGEADRLGIACNDVICITANESWLCSRA